MPIQKTSIYNNHYYVHLFPIGIERLCLSSENGKLHFYQLCEQSRVQIELTADSPDGMCNGDIFHDPDVKSENELKDKVEKKTLGIKLLWQTCIKSHDHLTNFIEHRKDFKCVLLLLDKMLYLL